jgi:PBP1b-binding outer membrane lipoprotein LpoB
MKKLSLVAFSTLILAGCASAPMGTVTPLKEGYTAEATVQNGDIKAAKKIALNTAEAECKKYNRGFYVIEESKEEANAYGMDDGTTDAANIASTLIFGKSSFSKSRTVSLKFDCK